MQRVGISESTYHYQIKAIKKPNNNKDLERRITTIFEENGRNYGYRRIGLQLKNEGYIVNHKKIQRIMREQKLICDAFTRKSRKYNSYKGSVGKTAPNRIKRKFKTSICHQKLTTDITEFKCTEGMKLYLNPIMDMFNGEILSYGISYRPNLELVINPLKEVLEIVKNSRYRTTIHSDQGWHYQHKQWVEALRSNKIFQSMSRKGNCLDNAPMENFFGLMKQEMYHGKDLCSFDELKARIDTYIHYYNNERIKQKLAGMSPVQYRIHTSQLAA